MISRRQLFFLCGGGIVAGAAPWLMSGCASRSGASGLPAIKWGREQCTQCGMVLSDRRFAVQMQSGPGNGHWNFDDIGCAITWLAARRWPASQQPQSWVASFDSRGEPHWLDAGKARYLAGRTSPMGYDFGAVEDSPPGSLAFEEMRSRVLDRRPAP